MAKKLPTITPEYVKELATYLEQKHQKRNDLYQELRDARFMKTKQSIPDHLQLTGFQAQSAAAFEMIKRSVAIMSAAMPMPKVIPTKATQKAQENSSQQEKWYQAAWHLMGKREYAKMLDATATFGLGIFKLYLKRNEWGGFADRYEDEDAEGFLERIGDYHRLHFPFDWEQIDNFTYYPVYDAGNKLSMVLEISSREAYPLAEKYKDYKSYLVRKGLGTTGRRDQFPSEAKFYELWTCNQWLRMVDTGDTGIVVGKGEHSFGRPPYFEAPAGITSSRSPDEQYLSLIHGLLKSQNVLDFYKTIRANWAIYTAKPVTVLEQVGDEAIGLDPKITTIDLRQGNVANVPPRGYKFALLTLPPVGTEMQTMYEEAKREVDTLSLAPILQGILPGSDTSNAAAIAMIAIAKSIFAPATDSIAKMFDDMAGFMRDCIERDLKEAVPIYVVDKKTNEWLELGPEDNQGLIRHSLEPVLPAERYQSGLFWRVLQADGAISMRFLQEIGLGVEAPEEMGDEIFLEEMENQPAVRQYIWQKVMELRGEGPEQAPAPPGTPAVPQGAMGGPGAVVLAGAGRPSEAQAALQQTATAPMGQM